MNAPLFGAADDENSLLFFELVDGQNGSLHTDARH